MSRRPSANSVIQFNPEVFSRVECRNTHCAQGNSHAGTGLDQSLNSSKERQFSIERHPILLCAFSYGESVYRSIFSMKSNLKIWKTAYFSLIVSKTKMIKRIMACFQISHFVLKLEKEKTDNERPIYLFSFDTKDVTQCFGKISPHTCKTLEFWFHNKKQMNKWCVEYGAAVWHVFASIASWLS